MATFTFVISMISMMSVVYLTSSDELYMSYNQNIMSYNTSSNGIRAYSVNMPSYYDVSDGAIVCGNVYYAYYDGLHDIDNGTRKEYVSGVFSFELDTKTFTSYAMSQDRMEYLAFACTQTPNVLLAGAVYQSTTMRYIYSLVKLTFDTDGSSCDVEFIGIFNRDDAGPRPHDVNIFSFNIADDELWALFPLGQYANLRVMDVNSGSVTNQYRYTGESDSYLYFTLPHTLSDRTFMGAIGTDWNNFGTDIDFVSFTINATSSELTAKTLIRKTDSYLKNGAYSSMTFCGDAGYVLVNASASGSDISSFNVFNG
eukprot:36521_1